MKFETTLEQHGKSATGIEVPGAVMAELGESKRPAVVVTVGTHTYRTTVARMGGRFLVPMSAENRGLAGVAAGDAIEVEIELDTVSRTVEVPADLAAVLDADSRQFFDGLAVSHRKEWVRWIEEAKKAETRATRVAKAAQTLQQRRSTR